ncbi:MAG: hypothetical protein HKL90_09085 [Elusimicrobia bacterium]|nr:hypothetical protein [Elusimicrobiota bacterium]
MTAYTALRATSAGVVFFEEHAARVSRAAGPAAERAFRDFAARVPPGCWAVSVEASGELSARPMPGSRLFDGMPSRSALSPWPSGAGPVEKAPPPGPYAALRENGVSVLLTSPDGGEIWESCSAAALAFDGRGLIHPPDDRPRVRSVAETYLRARFAARPAPIAADSRALVLVNAVKGVCVLAAPRSRDFPPALLAELRAAVESSARRA